MSDTRKIYRFDFSELHLAKPVEGELNFTFDEDNGNYYVFDGEDWCYVSETDINNILK